MVPLVAIGWVEFDEGYWRAGENPNPSRALCNSGNPAQPSFIWMAQALKGLPGTRQDPSLRGPMGNWVRCLSTRGQLGWGWLCCASFAPCCWWLRAVILWCADESPEAPFEMQILINLVWNGAWYSASGDAGATGQWTTLWRAGGWSTDLRRILKTCLNVAGMSAVVDWWRLWAIHLLFWLRSHPTPPVVRRWGNQGSERGNDLPKVLQLVSDRPLWCSHYLSAVTQLQQEGLSAILWPEWREEGYSAQRCTSTLVLPDA